MINGRKILSCVFHFQISFVRCETRVHYDQQAGNNCVASYDVRGTDYAADEIVYPQ